MALKSGVRKTREWTPTYLRGSWEYVGINSLVSRFPLYLYLYPVFTIVIVTRTEPSAPLYCIAYTDTLAPGFSENHG